MTNRDVSELAELVLEELEPGTVIGDNILLTKRQLIAIAGSGLGAGALAALGADRASAQAAGQVGTASSPVDVEAYNVNATSVNTAEGAITDKEIGLVFGDLTQSPRVASARNNARFALTVQPSGGDAPGSVEVFPSGTSTRSHFLATNANDPDNFGFVEFEVNGNSGWLHAQNKGTGTAPTEFRFYNFPDGVSVEDPITDNNGQGTAASPKRVMQHGSGVTTTGYGTAATTVTADGTNQLIYTTANPPLSGMMVVTGNRGGWAQTFTDIVLQVRNDAISQVNTVESGTPPARNYTLSGKDPQVSISDGGNTYDITVQHLGGGS